MYVMIYKCEDACQECFFEKEKMYLKCLKCIDEDEEGIYLLKYD